MPSHISLVEPLPPEWPSCSPILAEVLVCTKSVTRRNESCCSSSQRPAQPGVIRPSGDTHTISVITRPAPPSALPPRCTRWKSEARPSTATYMSIGETTTRLTRSREPIRTGWNIGGQTSGAPTLAAYHSSQRATNSGSRSRRLS